VTRDIEYNIVVSDGETGVLINWGEEPDWIETHSKILDNAVTMALVPKSGIQRQAVSVDLAGDKKWIVFSRVIGQITSNKEIRLYAIGWQKTTSDGVAIKSIVWVYPDGMIEANEEPSFVRLYMK